MFLIQERIKGILKCNNFHLLFYGFFLTNILASPALGNIENPTIQNKVKSNFIELQPAETIVLKKDNGIYPPQLFPTFLTSINNLLLVSNYKDIYVLNCDQSTLSKLKIPGQNKFGSWTPSGMHYFEKRKELFISNEICNTIIVCSFFENKKITIKYIYSGLNEPKNIYCSETDELVVANYGANKVSFYKRNLSKLTLLWEKDLLGCHGVCILDDKVYACGVGTIICWDYKGKELYRCQSLFGKNLGFLTSITPLSHSKALAVCDAKTGYCFLTTPQLKAISCFGSNGIGLNKFNYPYSICSSQDKLIVSSVYQDRIAFINLKDKKITSYCFQPHNWGWLKNEGIDPNVNIEPLSNNVFQLKKTILFGNLWNPSFNQLQNEKSALLMPSYVAPRSFEVMPQPWYATSYAENEDKLLLLANNSRIAILIDKKTGYIEFIDLKLIDCWGNGAYILTPQGKRDLDSYHFQKHTPEEFCQRLPFITIQELADFMGLENHHFKLKASIPPLTRLKQIITERHLTNAERDNLSSEFLAYISDTTKEFNVNLLDVFSFYALTNSKNYLFLPYFNVDSFKIFQKVPQEQRQEYIAYLKIILTAQPKLTKKQQEGLFDIMDKSPYLTNSLAFSVPFIKLKTPFYHRAVLLRTMRKLNLENRSILFKRLLNFSNDLPDEKLDSFIHSIIGEDQLTIDENIPAIMVKLIDNGISSVSSRIFLISFLNLTPQKYRGKILNSILNVLTTLNKIYDVFVIERI